MIPKSIVIPAQIRAGRALLDWSQEQLAAAAGVGINSVRDTESQKRPADSAAASAIRVALESEGIVFTPGSQKNGPGASLVAGRPNVIRWPTVVTAWDGIPFEIELQGNRHTVFVSREVLADIERLRNPTDAQLLKSFEKHRGRILNTIPIAASDKNNFDGRGNLYLRSKDFPDI